MFGKEKRFEVTKAEGAFLSTSIIVDKVTGVNYLFVSSTAEGSGGLTPLLNADGTPVVTLGVE